MLTREMIADKTPCYIYDEAMIRAQAKTLLSAVKGFDFLFSIKTNPFLPLVRVLAAAGIGADAASAGEVDISLAAGMPKTDIYYSAAGKTRQDLIQAWGKCMLTADSIGEVERIDALAKEKGETVEIGVRINTRFNMDGGAAGPSKFGVCEEDLPLLSEKLKTLKNVRIVGIHTHVKSQVLDAIKLAACYESCFALAKRVNEMEGFSVRFVNFGGGVGVVYDQTRERPLDFALLSAATDRIARENAKSLKARLIIESGRFLVNEAGTYYTRVEDVKLSRGKKFVVVTGGVNGFFRPAALFMLRTAKPEGELPPVEPLFTEEHAFAFGVLGAEGRAEEIVELTGCLCTAADVLASNLRLPACAVGDIVTISNAGAYACTLTPQLFSSHPAPGQYLLRPDGSLATESA